MPEPTGGVPEPGRALRWRARWATLVAEHANTGVALLYVVHRVLQKLTAGRCAIVPYRFVAQPVGALQLGKMGADPDMLVRRIAPDDPVVADFPRPREVVAQRFADGSECHVAWVKGRFAGHIWIARNRYVEDEVRCVYEIAEPATGVWDYDVYVEPRLRLGRTMGRLWKAVDAALLGSGARWSFSRINRFNSASLRSHQRLGAITVGRAVFIRLGAFQLAWLDVAGAQGRASWCLGVPPPIVLHAPSAPAGGR